MNSPQHRGADVQQIKAWHVHDTSVLTIKHNTLPTLWWRQMYKQTTSSQPQAPIPIQCKLHHGVYNNDEAAQQKQTWHVHETLVVCNKTEHFPTLWWGYDAFLKQSRPFLNVLMMMYNQRTAAYSRTLPALTMRLLKQSRSLLNDTMRV